jgi:hypothetical protein
MRRIRPNRHGVRAAAIAVSWIVQACFMTTAIYIESGAPDAAVAHRVTESREHGCSYAAGIALLPNGFGLWSTAMKSAGYSTAFGVETAWMAFAVVQGEVAWCRVKPGSADPPLFAFPISAQPRTACCADGSWNALQFGANELLESPK